MTTDTARTNVSPGDVLPLLLPALLFAAPASVLVAYLGRSITWGFVAFAGAAIALACFMPAARTPRRVRVGIVSVGLWAVLSGLFSFLIVTPWGMIDFILSIIAGFAITQAFDRWVYWGERVRWCVPRDVRDWAAVALALTLAWHAVSLSYAAVMGSVALFFTIPPYSRLIDDRQFARLLLRTEYLWSHRIGAIPDGKTGREIFENAVIDPWSAVLSASEIAQQMNGKRLSGIGIGTVDAAGRIRYVHSRSPANKAGVREGDVILDAKRSGAAAVSLKLKRGDAVFYLTVQRQDFDLDVVKFEVQGDTGVLWIGDFMAETAPMLESAFEAFNAAGVTKLRIDLRENGGGNLRASRLMDLMLGRIHPFAHLYTEQRYGERRRSTRMDFAVPRLESLKRLDEVTFLVSPTTCSASELAIAATSRFVTTRITYDGGNTCGKQVGFNPLWFGDEVFLAVSDWISLRD